MANLKNVNLMSQDMFESIEQADDELYAVQFGFMPDYEAIIDITSAETYTFPADGIFFMYSTGGFIAYGSNRFDSGFQGYTYGCFGNSNTATAVEYKVSKGETITRKVANGSYKAFFFPFK